MILCYSMSKLRILKNVGEDIVNIQLAGAFGIDEIIQYNQEGKNPKNAFSSYFPLRTTIPDLNISTVNEEAITAGTVLLVINLNTATWKQVSPILKKYNKTILIQFEAEQGWEIAYEKSGEFDYFINFDPKHKSHPGFRHMNIPYDPNIASSHRDQRGFSALIHQWKSSRRLFIETYLLGLSPRKKKSVLVATLNPGDKYQIRKLIADKWSHSVDVFGGGWPKSMRNYRGYVSSKVSLLKRYRFCLVMENQRQTGYVTEKLLDCIAAGTVPIYWGAKNIHEIPGLEWVPTIEDENSDLDLILKDDKLYWRCKRQLAENKNLIFQSFSVERFVGLVTTTILIDD